MDADNHPPVYTAEDRAALCDVLRRVALPMRSPPRNQWANPTLRMPIIVSSASPEGQPRTEEWMLGSLERHAREFLDKETAARKRPRPNNKEKLRAMNRLIARLMKVPTDAASKASAFAEFAAQVEAWAAVKTRRRSGGREPEANRDWLVERLQFIWVECGGEVHASENKKRGGPLTWFLQAACDPIFKRTRRKPLSTGQACFAVRKLLKERRPRG